MYWIKVFRSRDASSSTSPGCLATCLQVCLLVVVDAHNGVPRLGRQVRHQAGLAAAGGALQAGKQGDGGDKDQHWR